VPPSVDLVVVNGDLHTMDAARPRARALAVADGTIVAVGDGPEVLALRGPATQVLDLGGRTAVPGLIDAHVHLLAFGLSLGQVDLSEAASIDAAVVAVASAHEEQPDGWLLGRGFHPGRWPRWPTSADLDAVVGDRPVALRAHDGHSVWVSSAALRLAGVTASAQPPAGGAILRDASGEPIGVLQERAIELIDEAIGPPTPEQVDAALARAVRRCAEVGLAGVHVVEGRDSFAGIQRLRERGKLTLRVQANLWRDGFDAALALGLRTGLGDEWLRIGGLKLFADGALGSRTALMLEPYDGEPRNRGVAVLTREELIDYAERAASNGIALVVHAIGDLANRHVLDALARAREVAGPELRHRIEHAQIVHPDDVPRFAKLGVVASMQPTHATTDVDLADRYWGERSTHAYAWRSMLDAGVPLAFGSDCPVEPIDPLHGIFAAVTRQRRDGTPPGGWYPEQRLTVEEAVRAFTLGAAYAAGEEATKGSLSVGKVADLTVLSRDIFAVAPSEIFGTEAVMTIVGGRVVFERSGAVV